MQRQGLLALLLATVVVIVAAVAVVLGNSGSAGEARSGEVVLAGFASHIGDVAGLKITYVGGSMTLQRKDEGEKHVWTIAEKAGYPVDPAKIREVLLGFAELTLVEPKTRKKELYARLDVEDPGTDRGKEYGHSRGIEVTDAKGGELASLIVGKRRPDSL